MNTLFTLCRIRSSAVALFFFLALLVEMPSAHGQSVDMEDCSGGRLYYLAFPDTTTNTYDQRFPSQLIRTDVRSFAFYIYSPVDQQMTIGRVDGTGEKINLTGGEIYHYEAGQNSIPLVTAVNTPQTNVLKIETQHPVIVYGYILTPFGAEAYTAIPVEAWGTDYYAAAWPGEVVRDVIPDPNVHTQYNTVAKEGVSQILILAAYDNTQVRIRPTIELNECAGCTEVTLKKGEAYLVQSTVDTSAGVGAQPDIVGTVIQSSKPIGVISGNTRLMHNPGEHPSLAENSFKNLAMEWLPAIEQHGTEFVFTPTLDDRYQRQGLDPSESRDAEHVRLLATRMGGGEKVGVERYADSGLVELGLIGAGEFVAEKLTTPAARAFKTSGPAYAFASPNAVVKFNGTTTWGPNYIGASYLSWSTFMVELVPREQWTSFAPVRAPSLPTSMVHYMNLVTDSNNALNIYYIQGSRNGARSLVPFNKGKIPGTDLVWGSIRLNAGVDYFIEGENGARFTGHVYGSYRGQEQYRPGATRRDDIDGKGSGLSGGGVAGGPVVLHPGEYEEDVALMYGYPLAPSRCLLASPDDYDIEVIEDCGVLDVRIKAKNSPASGIRSIELLADSSENVRLEFLSPTNPLDFQSETVTEARVRIVPINPRDAHAVVIIKDHTREGRRWRVARHWTAERLDIDSQEVDFGELTVGVSAGERVVTVTNPLPTKNVVIRRLSFAKGTEGFVIERTDPNFAWEGGADSVVLEPGESMRVWVNITPTESRDYLDSLRVHWDCGVLSVALKGGTTEPCLYIGDLDFGSMNVGGAEVRRNLQVCNTGKGRVTFQDPWVTWLQTQASEQGFDIADTEIVKLKGKSLARNECVTIEVSFTPPTEAGNGGAYRTTARFWADTRNCRDTSVWRAYVFEPGPQITGYNWGEQWVSDGDCTKNPIEDYRATMIARNEGDSAFEVVGLTIENDPDGVFSILNTTITPGLIMNPQDLRDIDVVFDPKTEKVYYSPTPATLRLTYRMNINGEFKIGYVEAPLEGIGIESYVTISDGDFGKVEFTAPGATSVPGTVLIRSTGTRPLNIDQIAINSGPDFRFSAAWAAANPWATAADGNVLTLNSGQTFSVELEFVPQSADAPQKQATIDLIGDFAYDYCSKTDSSGLLRGQVQVWSATAEGYDFGSILTCFEEEGFITVRNNGTEPVIIANIGPVMPASMGSNFIVNATGEALALPLILQPGESAPLRIPVRFAPNKDAGYDASVDITVMSHDGSIEVAVLTVPLNGIARVTKGRMIIGRDYSGTPGSSVTVPIVLDSAVDEAHILEFILTLDYDESVADLGDVKLGDLFREADGWLMEIVHKEPGALTVRIYNTAGRHIEGTGDVLRLDFSLLGGTGETEISFDPTLVLYGENLNPCVDIAAYSGLLSVENSEASQVSLVEITPNPLDNRATIRFTTAQQGRVQVGVYTSDGRRVQLLLDEERGPGMHSVEWDATNLIKGAYYVQVKVGEESDSWGVRVLK